MFTTKNYIKIFALIAVILFFTPSKVIYGFDCTSSYTIRGYSGNHTICTDWKDNDGCGNVVVDGTHYPRGTSLCSANHDFCPVCSRNTPGLCAYGDHGALRGGEEINYQQTYNWSCSKNGGVTPCNYIITHGKCNTGAKDASNVYFDKTKGTFIPSRNPATMCTSGSLSGGWSAGESAGSTYNYSCLGSNGGRNDTGCSWTPPEMDGLCGGPFNGRIVNKEIPASQQTWNNQCSSGPETRITSNNSTKSYDWNCLGTYGGNDSICKAEMQPTIGKCNDLFVDGSTVVSEIPSDNFLCKTGSVKGTAQLNTISNLWTWVCDGLGGAAESGLCKVTQKTSDDQEVTEIEDIRLTELSVTGRITPNIVNKGQYCTLTDLQYKTNPGADNSFIVCNVYKGKILPANVYLDKDNSKDGHQVEPGYDYYYSCEDYATKVAAKPIVLKCVLNPVVIER